MSLDFNEAAHLLKEMNVPHFHHEGVCTWPLL